MDKSVISQVRNFRLLLYFVLIMVFLYFPFHGTVLWFIRLRLSGLSLPPFLSVNKKADEPRSRRLLYRYLSSLHYDVERVKEDTKQDK